MTTFWVSWEEKSEDYRPLSDPPNQAIIGWWKSGEAGDGSYATIVAWVKAEDEASAKAAVVKDWPGDRVWRFCNPCKHGFTPGDRFPLKGWEKKRAEALS